MPEKPNIIFRVEINLERFSNSSDMGYRWSVEVIRPYPHIMTGTAGHVVPDQFAAQKAAVKWIKSYARRKNVHSYFIEYKSTTKLPF